jgi:chromosome segregation ATPase
MISEFISKPPKASRYFFEHAGQSKLSPRRAELRAQLQATASKLTDTQPAFAVDQPALLRDVNAGFT